MMMHAYPEIFLHSAMSNLGDMFDYAIHDCHFTPQEFVDVFVSSIIAQKLEHGEPKYLVGKSGIEIAQECIEEVTGKAIDVEASVKYKRSPEYWCGWAVCYYQWYSQYKYKEIFQVITFADLLVMYRTLHEADISKFVDIMQERLQKTSGKTKLRLMRERHGFSQSKLSVLSGVTLHSIQLYEQRQKDINKARAITLLQLSRALNCQIEELLEPVC